MMAEAIGHVLPLAVGVALSPTALSAALLVLMSRRGRVLAPAFAIGWTAAIVVIGLVVLLGIRAAAPVGLGWLVWVEAVCAAGLVYVAVRRLDDRHHPGHRRRSLDWRSRLDRVVPLGAAAIGATVLASDAKDVLLTVGAAAVVAASPSALLGRALAFVVFVLVGTSTVSGVVLAHHVLGDRAEKPLVRLADRLDGPTSSVTPAVCLVLAAQLVGIAIIVG